MSILITGANGQLGQALARTLTVHRPRSTSGECQLFLFSHRELDITDSDLVMRVFRQVNPTVVIHAAAYTNVDGCELNPDLAFRTNALGTRNVAVAAEKVGAKLIYISTDYVFDGRDGTGALRQKPYTEFDRTNPLSVYGRSKLAGEEYALALTRRAFIVRTSWLYGPGGNNFVRTILRLAQERREALARGLPVQPLRVVDDQVGSPTYTVDLAWVIAQLLETERYGLYHVSNSGSTSWYQFARAILEVVGWTEVEITPITTAELGRPAPRPPYSVLDNYCLRLEGFVPLRPWREALVEFLATAPVGAIPSLST